ncbi:MAG: hypothetical protein ABIP63_07020 [Thermoanaerobaculia bacterium]
MRTAIAALAILTATTASAGLWGDCSYTERRNASAPADGLTRIVIVGRAGTLHITGRRGAAEVRATGTACSSDRDVLKNILLTSQRTGSELRVEAEIPDTSNSFFGSDASLDFEVAVPDSVALVIEDGSGEMTVESVASADITDGSGALEIRKVAGDLRVRDGSGELVIDDVAGSVSITDGSGDITIRQAGSVNIAADGSGSVDIRNVKRDVLIGRKGSGSVEVADVGGDLRVGRKGSGHVEYQRVAGRVEIPERNR